MCVCQQQYFQFSQFHLHSFLQNKTHFSRDDCVIIFIEIILQKYGFMVRIDRMNNLRISRAQINLITYKTFPNRNRAVCTFFVFVFIFVWRKVPNDIVP